MTHIENSREPSFLLIYAPQRQNIKFGTSKPEGSLGLLYLAGALQDNNFHVKVLDCSVGDERHAIKDTFYRQTELPNGMVRVGLTAHEIVHIAKDYDVIGITSIFTAQTTMVEEVVEAIRQAYPHKLIILGGVNARSLKERFFQVGANIICLSEAEKTIVEIGQVLRKGSCDFSNIGGIAWKHNGEIRTNPTTNVELDLDKLPFPRWAMLPLERYWEINRPHGGGLKSGPVPYAPVMTSRGCPFKCRYCHISREINGSVSGNLRQLRLKSFSRVLDEVGILQALGVRHIYLEDDSLLGDKERVKEIFRELIKRGLILSDVNGINLAHLTTNASGAYAVDDELLELMAEAGFKKLIYPVESGSQRVLNKYATGKLNLKKHNVSGLIRKAKDLGIEIGGNYMFGFPDETREEMMMTYACAEEHMLCGLDYANFMIMTHFPGTDLYEMALQDDLFLPGTKPEDLDWTRPSLKTLIPPEELVSMITYGWRKVNKPERVERIKSMTPVSGVSS